MTPYVVDANAIHAFQQERITRSAGLAHAAIEAIFAADCVALDKEKLCLQEWIDCAGGKVPYALMDWVGDELVNGRIRFYGLADTACRKQLQGLGLPKSDHKWIRLAIGCDGRKLVSGDVDFFDPGKKKASAKEKEALRLSRSGACCKALRKEFGIEVMCLEHVPGDVAA